MTTFRKPSPTQLPRLPSAVAPDSTTEGTVTAGGAAIAYKAVAGTITVGATEEQDAQLGPDGKPLPDTEMALAAAASKDPKDAPAVARMFYVAYFKKDAKAEDRPITFLYNGGPGSSTVWLHMGSFGPKHVVTADDRHLAGAPYKLVNNAYSLLDVSDLVFIDMPGTGFGRLVGKDKEKAFWGVDEDAHAYARFIARFISKYNRWNSPKYLFGESYGTTRSSVVSNILENDKSIDLNGVILLSQIFNFTSDIDAARTNPGIDLPFQLALPTYAATAYYHHKLPNQPAALEPFLKEVEDFAMGEYAHALAQGTDLSASEKQTVAEKLHNYTGLPVAYLLKADLRVSGGGFAKNLQDDQDLTTGRLDTRFSGSDDQSAERRGRVRSAELGDFVGVCFALQRLCAARSEVRRRADLSAAGAVRKRRVGPEAQRQSDQSERERRYRDGDEDESAAEGDGERRLLRPGDAVLRGVLRGQAPADSGEPGEEHRVRLVRVGAHGLCARRVAAATARSRGGVYPEHGGGQ